MSHVGIVAVSEPRLGGTFPYTLSMIEALRRITEHRYTIFTTRTNRAYDHLGLPVISIPPLPSAVSTFVGKVCRWPGSRGLFSEVDKVIAPIYTTYLLASRRPFAFTLHDLQEKYLPENFNYAQRVWRHATNALLTRAAARIICESGNVRNDIERFFGVEAQRISVIPAPPVSAFRDFQISRASLASVRERIRLPESFIFYPAQFFPHKNHLRLIDAFANVTRSYPKFQLVLTGKRQHDYEKVMAHVAQLGLSAKVTHLGYLDIQDLPAIYKLASLVVIPTLFESISIPIYEAFMMGVPVCASNVVALPEQVGDAGVLFDPLSAKDMAEKISVVLSDAQLQSELVSRGRRRVDALTMESYAQQLRVMLEQIK